MGAILKAGTIIFKYDQHPDGVPRTMTFNLPGDGNAHLYYARGVDQKHTLTLTPEMALQLREFLNQHLEPK